MFLYSSSCSLVFMVMDVLFCAEKEFTHEDELYMRKRQVVICKLKVKTRLQEQVISKYLIYFCWSLL